MRDLEAHAGGHEKIQPMGEMVFRLGCRKEARAEEIGWKLWWRKIGWWKIGLMIGWKSGWRKLG